MGKKKRRAAAALRIALGMLTVFVSARPAAALFVEDGVDRGGGGNPTASLVREDGRQGSGAGTAAGDDPGTGEGTGTGDSPGTGEGGTGGPGSGTGDGEDGPAGSGSGDGESPGTGEGGTGGPGSGAGDGENGPAGDGSGGTGDSPGTGEGGTGGPESGAGVGENGPAGDGSGAGEDPGTGDDGSGPDGGSSGNGPDASGGRPDGTGNSGELEVRDREQGISFLIPEKERNAVVGEDRDASFGILGAGEEDILSVRVNGEEVPYTFSDGRVGISRDDLPEGKVRVQVTVRAEDGSETEMEPWEFYRGDLYEGGPYGTMSADTRTESPREKDGSGHMKKRTGRIIAACVVLLLTIAAIGLSVFALKLRSEREKTEAEKMKTEALAEAAEETAEEAEAEAEATPAPTDTPAPTPTPAPTATPAPTPTPTPEPKIGDGKTVCIDPGHQDHANTEQEPIGPGAAETKYKVTGGTSGAASGLAEYELVLSVSFLLRDELEERGYKVVMTRDRHDVDISNSERAAIAAESGADVFVRVHANGSDNPSAAGALTYQPTENNPFLTPEIIAESRRLSETVLRHYLEVTGAEDDGIISGDNMSGINWSTVPVTIVELGYMTNPEEDLLMATPEYQEKMAKGIADGIDAFFEEKEEQ